MISLIIFIILSISIIISSSKERFNFPKLYRPYIVPVLQKQEPIENTINNIEEAIWSDWSVCDSECGSGNKKRTCIRGKCIGETHQKCQNYQNYQNKECPKKSIDTELTVAWVKDRYNTFFFADKLNIDVEDINIIEDDVGGYTLATTKKIETINFPNEDKTYYVNLNIEDNIMNIKVNVKKFMHNTIFNTYLNSFIKEFKSFTKNTLNMNDVNIMFDPKNTLLEGINGEAYTLGNKTFLVINETKWNNLKTESAKELLIFHELGHGVLGRNHKEFHTSTIVTDNLNRKIPASIMGRPKVPSYVYEKNRDAYLHELFHSPNNEELDLSILQRSISMYKDETVMFTISDIKLNSGVDLEINKNNVTKIPIILTIKGIIKGDKNIKIDKMIEVPSDIDGINSSTKIELLKDRRDLGKGVITIDITLMIGETKMDQKSLRIKSLNSFEI